MIKIEENENDRLISSFNTQDKVLNLLCHVNSDFVEGNKQKISIHEILITSYAKIVGLKVNKTKSHSPNHSNILIETLPIISYGINLGERISVPYFLKEITNLNQYYKYKVPVGIIHTAEKLEKVILTDLQLFLNLINYFNYHRETPLWKKILNFIYQPVESTRTYFKDRRVLGETWDVFSSTGYQEIFTFIKSINKKIENYLDSMGGVNYCEKVTERDLNFMDVLIFSAYKAQSQSYSNNTDNKSVLELCPLAKALSIKIEELIYNTKKIKNNIILKEPHLQIVENKITIKINNKENLNQQIFKNIMYFSGVLAFAFLIDRKRFRRC